MPIITVEGPALPFEAKRKLVKDLTDAAALTYSDMPRGSIVILIKPLEPENVAAGGELLTDNGD